MKKFVLVFCLLLALVCAFCACEEDVTPTRISVQSATINENGELVITLSDGSTHNKGKLNIEVENVTINEDGEAIVTLTDGSVHNTGAPTYSHSHSYGSYVDYSATNSTVSCDKRVYYRTCSGCGDVEWRTGGEHTFQTVTDAATCTQTGTETKTCTTCGKVETTTLAIVPHSYETTYRYNGSHHWYKCADCDAITEKAEHTEGEDGLCTVCGEPTGPTEGVLYLVNGDHAEVLGYTGTAAKVRIADTYEGKPVTVIGANAFQSKSITSISLPEGITSIGSYAFYSCNLTSISIPASVTSIGSYAFHHCSNLTSVTFAENSQLTSIGSDAFYSCGLTSISIPEGVTSIGSYAFCGCSKLTSISIPTSVTSIGGSTFRDCSQLTSISIPEGVTSIGNNAFYGCSNLTSVTFENQTGWKAGGTAIPADHLNNPAVAATYLTATYMGNDWTRSDP